MQLKSKTMGAQQLLGVLQDSVAEVNKKYFGDNIRIENEVVKQRHLQFVLRCHDSRKPGASRTATGRRSPSANWHVHGHIFDAIFKRQGDAVIIARGNKITKARGDWVDFEVAPGQSIS